MLVCSVITLALRITPGETLDNLFCSVVAFTLNKKKSCGIFPENVEVIQQHIPIVIKKMANLNGRFRLA